LDSFEAIFKKSLSRKEYGYIQAIFYQLTSDKYLKAIAVDDNSERRVHRVTPKGFAFVTRGGYKEQVRIENEKLTLNKRGVNSAILGWVVATLFGSLQAIQSYQQAKINGVQIVGQQTEKRASEKMELRLKPRQIPEKSSDTLLLPTNQKK
jgi:hypothetical protein